MAPPPSIEDAFLAYRCTREPEALAKVYDCASARLLSVAIHLTRSPATAEDVVQDTFLVALENPDRWDQTKPLMPWLLGILSNRVRQVDGLSRRAIDPARLLVPDANDPQEDFEATEMLAQVDDAITHLPQPYRGVVLLRLRNGLSPADISIALGRNPNTVRTQLARGMEMLRKVLPVSIAAMIAGPLAAAAPGAAAGALAARQTVLQRATERKAQFDALHRVASLRRAAPLLVTAAAVALLTWSLWPGTQQPSPPPATHTPRAELPQPATPADERAGPAPLAAAARDERTPQLLLGSAVVTVLVHGSGAPFATVELEPLADPLRLFVHDYAYPHGNWRAIVPAEPLGRDRWRSGTTAAGGVCTFADLQPGYWVCRALGVASVFEVAPGRSSVLRLRAPANTTTVHGVVLDADGRPIADAPIWELNRRVRPSSVVVTHSDEHGRFSLTAPPRTTVGAFHPGFAPVAVTVSPRQWTPQRRVELRFVEPGASVAGQVLGPDGRPHGGAIVEVGHPSDLVVAWASTTPKVLARVHRTRTDADGRYHFPSLV
ncbi:MAG: sigma-70 family RNA polymerase sigma factor, partial [Planctomycetes bacterium]|nr:sigma-70 family RNA polymerase sigma factor [Planctomycetota bacterium]